MLPAYNIFFVVRVNFCPKAGVLRTCLPETGKVIRRARSLVLEAWPYYTFQRASHRSEEVGGRLSIRTFESKVNEVFFGITTPTEVYLSAFVENQDLVKDLILLASAHKVSLIDTHIISTLGSLVYCNRSC